MAQLKQSTAYTRMFVMVDSTDHITGKTGLTVTLTLSKAGGAFAAAGGTVTEVSSGWYKVALTTTDTNTAGDLAYHATATGADPTDFTDQVISGSPGGTVDANVVSWEGVAPNALIAGRVDSNVGAMQNNVVTAAAIADAAIDRATFAVDTGLQSIRSNTAQAGGASTITLDAGASALDNFYNGTTIYLTGGAGVGQDRVIVSYTGATKVATLGRNWTTNPDATTTFAIQPVSVPKTNDNLEVTAAGGSSMTLSPSERNAIADAFLDRNMAAGVDSGTDLTFRTPRQALRTIRNKSCIVGTTQTVYKEDDTTPDHNLTLVGTPGANPVTCATPS